MIATKDAVKLRAQTEIHVREGSSDSAHNPFHVGDAAVILDLLLDVDASGDNYLERAAKRKASETSKEDFDAHVRLSATLRALLAHAIAIRKADKPKLFSRARTSWLSSGIRVVREDLGWKSGIGSVIEMHYHCAICDENLATLGANTVGIVAPEFERKLERHVRPCAMQFLLALHLPARTPDPEDE